jgi:hypothetical protein
MGAERPILVFRGFLKSKALYDDKIVVVFLVTIIVPRVLTTKQRLSCEP